MHSNGAATRHYRIVFVNVPFCWIRDRCCFGEDVNPHGSGRGVCPDGAMGSSSEQFWALT